MPVTYVCDHCNAIYGEEPDASFVKLTKVGNVDVRISGGIRYDGWLCQLCIDSVKPV